MPPVTADILGEQHAGLEESSVAMQLPAWQLRIRSSEHSGHLLPNIPHRLE
jgi:hypothetical protein